MPLRNLFTGVKKNLTASGPMRVGWLLDEPRSGVVFFAPERVRSVEMNKDHAKSASRCPAITDMESRHFVIRAPFDLSLGFRRDEQGKPGLKNLLGDKSPVRGSVLRKILNVTNEIEWRYPDRPTIQISLPYTFISDEPCYMSQIDAFMHYRREPMPGTIFGGRFPIDVWPRPLMWAFEWHDISKPLNLKRGEPWFYVKFETTPQNRPISLIEAEHTSALKEYMEHNAAVVGYVNQTFSLFKQAKKVRPERLLFAKKR